MPEIKFEGWKNAKISAAMTVLKRAKLSHFQYGNLPELSFDIARYLINSDLGTSVVCDRYLTNILVGANSIFR